MRAKRVNIPLTDSIVSRVHGHSAGGSTDMRAAGPAVTIRPITAPVVTTTTTTPALSVNAPPFEPATSDAPADTPSVRSPASVSAGQQSSGEGEAMEPVSTLVAASLTVALLAQQLPSLPNFNGENVEGDGESFSDWLERLELVATACKWDNQAKLVNVATRLRGTATRFYQSCTPQQRSGYDELVAALRRRFTPVHIQSVQSSIFHERKQRVDESVDDYSQDLRKLFHRAYSGAQGGGEAEAMGKSVLSYQFVAGLADKIKAKIVGRTGTFEELLAQARFEEARQKNIASSQGSTHPFRKKGDNAPVKPGGGEHQHPRPRSTQRPPRTARGCFSCGGTGYFAKECPMRGRGAPAEARGKSGSSKSVKAPSVLMLQAANEEEPDKRIEQKQDSMTNDDMVDDNVTQVVARIHGIEAGPTDQTTMGPVPISEVEVEGLTTQALLDTGSPVSIISLDFFLRGASAKKSPDLSPADWGREVRKRLLPATMSLRSYGGTELPVVAHVMCQLTRRGYSTTSQLQVQKGAPVDLLLGTDTLPRLGFSLTEKQDCAERDVLQGDAAIPEGPASQPAEVKLIRPAHLPAGHSKVVRVEMTKPGVTGETCLFEPAVQQLGSRGLTMADALVGVGDEREATLVVANAGVEPVLLEEGDVVGSLQQCTLVPASDADPNGSPGEVYVSAIRRQVNCKQREKQLWDALEH